MGNIGGRQFQGNGSGGGKRDIGGGEAVEFFILDRRRRSFGPATTRPQLATTALTVSTVGTTTTNPGWRSASSVACLTEGRQQPA